MKVFLDTNIWRYIADADAFNTLETTASDNGIELVVAPALVHEVSQFRDDTLRKKILKMVASSSMVRLMPETYLEAEDIKKVFEKYRRDWLIQAPDCSEIDILIDDWKNLESGFWTNAVNDTSTPVTDESQRGEMEHELAQQESKDIRRRMIDDKSVLPASLDLKKVYFPLAVEQPESNRVLVEYWRVPSLYIFKTEFEVYTSPYREWLDYFIDVSKVEAQPDSLTELWYSEISSNELPRQWLRGAFEYLQSFHKITSGTPGDSQLSSHLIDVDVVMSADRNFIRFTKQCRKDAPFTIAQEYLISAGADGVEEVFRHFRELNT
ncbi:MAG: hypothetical protein ACI9T7_000515 [Oleiphilaceae bacterium]|jgi:hypothetical protein